MAINRPLEVNAFLTCKCLQNLLNNNIGKKIPGTCGVDYIVG